MLKHEYVVRSRPGLYDYHYALLVETFSERLCEVEVEKIPRNRDSDEAGPANGKSILSLMIMFAMTDDILVFKIDGPQEAETLEALKSTLARIEESDEGR